MVSKDYMAGFFDADGYIGVVKGSSGYYNLKCTITNVDKITLQLMQKEYGGKVSFKHFKNPEHRNQFVLTWSGQDCIDFIKLIKNYTFVKHNQIESALSFPIGRPGLINTEEVTKKRDRIYEELKSMKKTEYNGDGV